MKKFSPPQMKEVSFPTPHTPHPTPHTPHPAPRKTFFGKPQLQSRNCPSRHRCDRLFRGPG
ncbi:hypothetical protein [Microcystis sp. M169S2]|uniref:hypothetical protein n=1 Tax=Microcystis sp. M169S2 TaxID=2771157 RepID=UPI0025844DEB|nr:hypothetical protein [Microcystis sp. M169S2]